MLKKLALTFGSLTKAQEIVYLLHDVKDVVRQGFYEEELPKVEKFCDENGLHLVKSKFKVLLADEHAVYSNKGMRIPESDSRRGMYFVYISKDEEKALLANYYELVGNDIDLGKLLGYPSCCVDYFQTHFSGRNPNPEVKALHPMTNISKRNEDAVIISHFPCSGLCSESVAVAKKYLDALIKVDKERVEFLLEKLKI